MKGLYQEIIEKLTNADAISLFETAGIKPVQYIDIYKGQYLDYESYDLIPCPAVLVQWSKDYRNKLITITLHCIYELVSDTSNISESKTEAFKIFDFIELVHRLVFKTESQFTGKLEPVSEEPVQLNTPGVVQTITYTGSYTDKFDNIKDYGQTDGDGEFETAGNLVEKYKNVNPDGMFG